MIDKLIRAFKRNFFYTPPEVRSADAAIDVWNSMSDEEKEGFLRLLTRANSFTQLTASDFAETLHRLARSGHLPEDN